MSVQPASSVTLWSQIHDAMLQKQKLDRTG
jgi:hypothetical protein